MTDPKKETVWITIPDEATPALETPVRAACVGSADKVRNKVFWGVGFVILVAFVSLLFAPQQFASLLKGDLFDGNFQLVPDYEDQEGGALFGGGDSEESEGDEGQASAGAGGDEMVVEAESEAVSIQVEPVEPVNGEVSGAESSDEAENGATGTETAGENVETGEGSDGTGTVTSAEVTGSEAESVVIDTETGEFEPITGSTGVINAEGATSDTDLIQSLSKQLNDLKEKEAQNDQLIQDLMQLIEDQAAGLHGAAGTQDGATFLPEGAAGQLGTDVASQIGAGTVGGNNTGVYRYNTHTVTVSPYDILAQNKAITTQTAAYQANVSYQPVQYSQQSYNPMLSGVEGQPGTGPAETILFAFALASLGVLVWGAVRAARA